MNAEQTEVLLLNAFEGCAEIMDFFVLYFCAEQFIHLNVNMNEYPLLVNGIICNDMAILGLRIYL